MSAHMLSTFGVLVVLSAAILICYARLSRRVNEANLGRMSNQWIAENRAAKS